MAPKLSVIEIVARDMAASLAFYRLLGLDLPASADGESHVEAELPGGMKIAWDTVDMVRSFYPDWEPPAGAPRMSLAFDCGNPADVDKTYAELTSAGYEVGKEPWDAFWGMRYAVVHDPDGNGIDLFATL